jgi:hypothetical protein
VSCAFSLTSPRCSIPVMWMVCPGRRCPAFFFGATSAFFSHDEREHQHGALRE